MSWDIRGLKPGMSRDDALALLGKPVLEQAETLDWEDGLTAWIEHERVVRCCGPGPAPEDLGEVVAGQPGLEVYAKDGQWLSLSLDEAGEVTTVWLDNREPELGPRRWARVPQGAWSIAGLRPGFTRDTVPAPFWQHCYPGGLTIHWNDDAITSVAGPQLGGDLYSGMRLESLLSRLGLPSKTTTYYDGNLWLTLIPQGECVARFHLASHFVPVREPKWSVAGVRPGMSRTDAEVTLATSSQLEVLVTQNATVVFRDNRVLSVSGDSFWLDETVALRRGERLATAAQLLGRAAVARPSQLLYLNGDHWLFIASAGGVIQSFRLDAVAPVAPVPVPKERHWSIAGLKLGMQLHEAVALLGEPAVATSDRCGWKPETWVELAGTCVTAVTGQVLDDGTNPVVRKGDLGSHVRNSLGPVVASTSAWDVFSLAGAWITVAYDFTRVLGVRLDTLDPRPRLLREGVELLQSPPIPKQPPTPPPGWRLDSVIPGMHRDLVVEALGVPTTVTMTPTRANFVNYSPWFATFGDLTVRFADLLVASVEGGTKVELDGQLLARLGDTREDVERTLGPATEALDDEALYDSDELHLHLTFADARVTRLNLHGRPLGPPFEDLPPAAGRVWVDGWAIAGVTPGMHREQVFEMFGEPTLALTSPMEAAAGLYERLAFERVTVHVDDRGLVFAVMGAQLELFGSADPLLRAGDLRDHAVHRLGRPDWPSRPFSALAVYRCGPQELHIDYDRDLIREFSLEHRKPGHLPPDPPDETDQGPGSLVPRKPVPGGRVDRERKSLPR